MQVVISLDVLSALADIADGANRNEYSDKIFFMPGLKRAYVCNGHMLAVVYGLTACTGTVGSAISAKRCKVILAEAKSLKLKGHTEVILCDNQDEFDEYEKQVKHISEVGAPCNPKKMFLYKGEACGFPCEGIEKYVSTPETEGATVLPTYNIKYQARIGKLWKVASRRANANQYAPSYEHYYIDSKQILHCASTFEGDAAIHACIMPYKR